MKRTFLLALAMAAVTWTAEAGNLNNSRLEVIDNIVSEQFAKVKNAGIKNNAKSRIYANVNDPNLKKKIYALIDKDFPVPKAKVKGLSARTNKEINDYIAKNFTWKTPEEVAAGAAKIAEREVPLVKVGDEVSVHYLKNRIYKHSEGKIESIRDNYRTIEIKHELIPVAGIDKKERLYFDPAMNEEAREKVRDYIRKNANKVKQVARTRLVSEELAKLKENESAGYIFYMDAWRTPRAVTDLMINRYKQITTRRFKYETQREAAKAKAKAKPAKPAKKK